MKQLIPSLPCSLLTVILFALTACNTAPEKPHTPQHPPPIQQPPPPQQQMESRSEQEQNAQSAATEAQPSSQQSRTQSAPSQEQTHSAPPPRAEEPDVEITDIPVDEDGNPIIKPQPAESQSAQSNSSSSPSAGGGAANQTSGQRQPDSGGSSGSNSQLAGAAGGPVVNIGAMTEAERVAALEKDLDGKLAKFDELMRRAREDAERDRAAANAGGRYGGAPSSGQGGHETPPQSGRGAGGQADSSSGRGHTPDLAGSGEGDYKYASGGPTPQDIQDSRDDDIVARQLREAASGEADPVLREKLWDEYRKYKKGIGR